MTRKGNSEAHALASAELLKEPKNKRYIEPESVLGISTKVLTQGRSAWVEMVECLTLTWDVTKQKFMAFFVYLLIKYFLTIQTTFLLLLLFGINP